MLNFFGWVLLTIAIDLVVIGIRWTVFTLFADVPVIKKYIIDPTDKCENWLSKTVDDLDRDAEAGSDKAKSGLRVLAIILATTYGVAYLVPFAAIPMMLVFDPVICVLVVKGKISFD